MMTLRAAIIHMLLPRYAGGGLPAPFARWVRTGIAEDPALADLYTELRRLERAAAGGAPTSAGQHELLEAALFAELDLGAAPVKAASAAAGRLLPFAAAFASAALFVMAGSRDEGFGAGDLDARGGLLAADPLGVKVSCVRDDRVVDTATAGARRPSDSLACPAESLLAFALTNLSHDERYVFVVGVAGDGSMRWYAPFDRTASAFRVAPGKNNDVLPVLGDTRGMPADERVSLHVLLSDQPFSATDVDRQLAAAQRRGVPLGSIDRLPLPDIPLQARVDMVRRR